MSKKQKIKSNPTLEKSPFSEKEMALMRSEIRDAEAGKRNFPIISEQFLYNPSLHRLRINPFELYQVMDHFQHSASAHLALGEQESINYDRYFDTILKHYAERIDIQALIDILIPVTKNTKIKREKRALLWATSEILSTISQQRPLSESIVVRSLIYTSMTFAMDLFKTVSKFTNKVEPYTFDYQQIMEGNFNEEEWIDFIHRFNNFEPDFTSALSQQALLILKECSPTAGLRFHHIIRYPLIMKHKQKRNILLPGETVTPEENPLEEESLDKETLERISVGIWKDLSFYKLNNQSETYFCYIKDAIRSIRDAAFGKVDENRLHADLNAIAYCFLSGLPINPFLAKLYQVSGENAENINPSDEKEIILDLKGSPENPHLYRKYAELLEQKEEKLGALHVYMYLQEISPDSELEIKITDLIQSIFEQQNSTMNSASNPGNAEPKSTLIVAP